MVNRVRSIGNHGYRFTGYRITGLQGYMITRLQVYWIPGLLDSRFTGFQVYWVKRLQVYMLKWFDLIRHRVDCLQTFRYFLVSR